MTLKSSPKPHHFYLDAKGPQPENIQSWKDDGSEKAAKAMVAEILQSLR